jgi:hypothetical protein
MSQHRVSETTPEGSYPPIRSRVEHAEDSLGAFGCEASRGCVERDGARTIPPVACDGLSWLSRLTSASVSPPGLGSGPGSLDEELGVTGSVFGYAADMSALENRSAGRLQLSVLRGRWFTSTATR